MFVTLARRRCFALTPHALCLFLRAVLYAKPLSYTKQKENRARAENRYVWTLLAAGWATLVRVVQSYRLGRRVERSVHRDSESASHARAASPPASLSNTTYPRSGLDGRLRRSDRPR